MLKNYGKEVLAVFLFLLIVSLSNQSHAEETTCGGNPYCIHVLIDSDRFIKVNLKEDYPEIDSSLPSEEFRRRAVDTLIEESAKSTRAPRELVYKGKHIIVLKSVH